MNNIKEIKVYSTSWCGDCIRSKGFLDENKVEYTDIDIEKNPEFIEFVKKLNNGNQTVPTIIISFNDGSEKILSEPSNDELKNVIGI